MKLFSGLSIGLVLHAACSCHGLGHIESIIRISHCFLVSLNHKRII